jgi:hypothetical protein
MLGVPLEQSGRDFAFNRKYVKNEFRNKQDYAAKFRKAVATFRKLAFVVESRIIYCPRLCLQCLFTARNRGSNVAYENYHPFTIELVCHWCVLQCELIDCHPQAVSVLCRPFPLRTVGQSEHPNTTFSVVPGDLFTASRHANHPPHARYSSGSGYSPNGGRSNCIQEW